MTCWPGCIADLGFDALGDEVFRDLVIARVVEPTSLLDAGRVLAEMGRAAASLSTRKRTLRRCVDRNYRDRLAELCFTHVLACGDVSLVLYDVTTLYFEAEHEDGLRKVGYSKERRVDPQIVVGLLVDRQGFPLEIGCFEGNKAEKHTILPVISQFRARHGIENFAVVADAGMLSAANLAALDDGGLQFIVGSTAHQGTDRPGVTLPLARRLLQRRAGHRHPHPQDRPQRRQRPGPARRTGVGPRGAPDVVAGGVGILRAAAPCGTPRPSPRRRTAPATSSPAARPPARPGSSRPPERVPALTRPRSPAPGSLAGLKGYVTNIPATVMPATEVITSYHDLWHVEQSFRMSKTDLAARPMFARTRDAIEAHLTIVFTALAVSRTVQNRTGLSIRRVRQLRPLRSATIEINGAIHTFPPALGPEQQKILDDLRH